MQKYQPHSDKVKFFFRPLKCSYLNKYFLNYENYFTLDEFNSVCVSDSDPKPQIRFANTHTYFNITNEMSFEDIEFTGEDLFARVYQQADRYSYTTYDSEQKNLAFLPFSKCTVTREPTQFHSKLEFNAPGTSFVSSLTEAPN